MIKKLALSIFMLTAVMFWSASAQTQASPEKQAAIKEFVQLINGDNKVEQMMNVMSAQLQMAKANLIKELLDEHTELTAAERAEIERQLAEDPKYSAQRMQERLLQKINFNEMVNEIAVIVYDKYYTLEEIRDLNAFYKTPTGQKSLKLMTPLFAETIQMTQERLVPKILDVIKEIDQENRIEIVQKINRRKSPAKKAGGK